MCGGKVSISLLCFNVFLFRFELCDSSNQFPIITTTTPISATTDSASAILIEEFVIIRSLFYIASVSVSLNFSQAGAPSGLFSATVATGMPKTVAKL